MVELLLPFELLILVVIALFVNRLLHDDVGSSDVFVSYIDVLRQNVLLIPFQFFYASDLRSYLLNDVLPLSLELLLWKLGIEFAHLDLVALVVLLIVFYNGKSERMLLEFLPLHLFELDIVF